MSQELRALEREMGGVAARLWARYNALKDAGDLPSPFDGGTASALAQYLVHHGLDTATPQDIERLRRAEQFADGRPPITIVIPTRNTKRPLETCVKSVLAHVRYLHEVIVVDAGTDGSRHLFTENNWRTARRIECPRSTGFAHSCNLGARHARGRAIIFLNSDTVVTDGWDQQLLTALGLPGVAAAGPLSNRVKGAQFDPGAARGYVNQEQLDVYAERVAGARRGEFQDAVKPSFLSGFCLAVNADAWDDISEFDERFSPGNYEDDDWCQRAALRGYRLVIARGAYVHHAGAKTFESNALNYQAALSENGERYIAKWSNDLPLEVAA